MAAVFFTYRNSTIVKALHLRSTMSLIPGGTIGTEIHNTFGRGATTVLTRVNVASILMALPALNLIFLNVIAILINKYDYSIKASTNFFLFIYNCLLF